MEERQLKLLKALAKKIRSEKKERADVVASLQSARILTKNENFTCHLKNLDKVFAEPE
jgi:N-glycosylase/DNA lyase